MFACCVSGFITSHNFKNMVGSIKCAYERIYYDGKYGELSGKTWGGLKNNEKLSGNYEIVNNPKLLVFPEMIGNQEAILQALKHMVKKRNDILRFLLFWTRKCIIINHL